jgi:hypothetical protein
MSGVEVPMSTKKEKQDKYTLLITLLVLIGMLIIILFIFLYHRRKLRMKTFKQKVRDVIREKRIRKYMLKKNSIKLVNNSSIKLKILGNSDLNIINKNEKSNNHIEIFDKSDIKNSSTGVFKEEDMILKLTVPKYKLNIIPFDTDNFKTKSNVNTCGTNSPRNNMSKSIVHFNNSKSLVSINNSPTNTVLIPSHEDNLKKKTPIEEEINYSVNSSLRKSRGDTEKNSECNLNSLQRDEVIMVQEKASCKEDEELEKIATIKLIEKDLDCSVSSL